MPRCVAAGVWSGPETGRVTEDELLEGVTDALTLGRWDWTHTRRSDLAQLMGTPGVPDIIAVSGERGMLLALELKSDHGQPTRDQARWLTRLGQARHVSARLVYPGDYDALLAELVGERLQRSRLRR